MRRLGKVVMVVAMAAAVAGCGGGDGSGGDGDVSPSTSAATVPVPSTGAATTTPAAAATSLTLRITDVRLVNSEESDSGMRVLLPAGVASASVTLTGLPSPNRVVSVCQTQALERRFSAAACRTPANGEAVTVALGSTASGVEIVQVGASGTGAAGSTVALDEVNIRYAASSREVKVRLPQIAAGEAGGRPTFALTPPGTDGTYRATLTWTVIPVFGGTFANGQLELVTGGSSGNQAQSSSTEVRLEGKVPTPVGDVVIRAQNSGTSALVSPTLVVLMP